MLESCWSLSPPRLKLIIEIHFIVQLPPPMSLKHSESSRAEQLYNYTQSLVNGLCFVQSYRQILSIQHVSRPMNAPAVLVLDTRVTNELVEIEEENWGKEGLESRCLGERAGKVLGLFRGARGMEWQGEGSWQSGERRQQAEQVTGKQQESWKEQSEREQEVQTERSPPKITQQVSVSLAPNPRSKKVETLLNIRQPQVFPYSPLSQSHRRHTQHSPHLNRSTQTNATPTQTQPCKTGNPMYSATSAFQEPSLYRPHSRSPLPSPSLQHCQNCKQNISISINQPSCESRYNQNQSSRQRPHLNFASGTLINIHEVLRARKESRSHDSEKTKKMDDFRHRIETEMDGINKELRTIKEGKEGKEGKGRAGHDKPIGDTDTDEKIEELEEEIRRISLKEANKSPQTQTVTLKLDISAKCVATEDPKRKGNTKFITANLSKSRTKIVSRNTTKTFVDSRTTEASKSKEKDVSKRTYWRRTDQDIKTQYINKVLINEKEIERKSLEKLKQSMSHAERKPLLSTRITQISKREGEN